MYFKFVFDFLLARCFEHFVVFMLTGELPKVTVALVAVYCIIKFGIILLFGNIKFVGTIASLLRFISYN